MSLSFVNIRGETVVPVAVKARPKPSASADSYHKGWQVVGYSPEHLDSGRREHTAEQRKEADPKPFDEVTFMRMNKPRPVRSQPYAVLDAAEQCAELARRSGWKLVQSLAKTRGVR